MSNKQRNRGGARNDRQTTEQITNEVENTTDVETMEQGQELEEQESTALTVVPIEEPEIDKDEQIMAVLQRLKVTNKLAEKRSTLADMAGKVNHFKDLCDDVTDTIILRTGNKKAPEIPINKPDAVKEVLALLVGNLDKSISETEDEILNVQKVA